MKIEAARLTLCRLQETDVDDVFQWSSDPEVSRYMSWTPHKCRNEAAEFIQSANDLYRIGSRAAPLAIQLKETGAVIGTCNFREWCQDEARGEIAFALSPLFWGRGLMKEAVVALINHGFSLGLHRIQATVELENIRSRALLKRIGFEFEGILRGYVQKLPNLHIDLEVWSVLRTDWR